MDYQNFYEEGLEKAYANGHLQELWADQYAQGYAEGRIAGRVLAHCEAIAAGKMTLKKAAQSLGMTLEEFCRIAEENGVDKIE